MKLRRASCLLCPRTAHSAPASHRSCSARQTGTSRRSYGSRFSQPLFRLPFADVARVYAAFKSRAARVHGLRHAPAFPDDLGTLAQAAARLLRFPGRRRRGRAHLGRAVRDQSTRLAASWIRENDLASALPNTPKITAGPLIVQGRPAAAPTEAILAHA